MKIIPFPDQSEYPTYIEMYLKWVKKDGSLLEQLEQSLVQAKELVSSLSIEELECRYQEDKWSIKEILVHIIDDERIYAYRALAFARNDKTSLPGFEQDVYSRYADVAERSIINIMEEYEAVCHSTIAMFKGFSETALMRMEIANGNKASVRALGYHMLGHEMHHLNFVKETYLGKQV